MGRVHQINTSNGGVPKLAVDSAVVDATGVVGDEQADKVHHGSPDQALCLYSLEVIETLRSEGHSIAPGAAGENITVSGLDWQQVVPGSRMKIGPVEVEITYYATPCTKNAQWFKDGKFNRMHASKHPGESRVYARVLEGGPVATGDPVELFA
ncbi:MAG: MOSC domain-containing protein [Actinomycetota bacterium]